jgi:hypothetical protein
VVQLPIEFSIDLEATHDNFVSDFSNFVLLIMEKKQDKGRVLLLTEPLLLVFGTSFIAVA